MIYSARVLELHSNFCSCEADSEEEAKQKFLKGLSDCDGHEEYISTMAVVDMKPDPNFTVSLKTIEDRDAKNLLAGAIDNRIKDALARIEDLEDGIEHDPDGVFEYLTPNKWMGLRGFLAGLKDELLGEVD